MTTPMQQDFENSMKVEFWIDDHIHAIRHTRFIPAVGDEVRFDDVVYKIHYRLFVYDEKYPRVALNMEKLERAE